MNVFHSRTGRSTFSTNQHIQKRGEGGGQQGSFFQRSRILNQQCLLGMRMEPQGKESPRTATNDEDALGGGHASVGDENDWKDDDFLAFPDENSDAKDEEESRESAMDMSSSEDDEDGPGGTATNDGTSSSVPPPWMAFARPKPKQPRGNNSNRYPQGPHHLHPLTQLHNEIVGFCKLMEPTSEEIDKRQALVSEITELVLADPLFAKDNVKVQVFGSQATGLFLPTSDIDLVIITDHGPSNTSDDKAAADTEQGGKEESSKTTDKEGDGGDTEDEQLSTYSPLHHFAKLVYDSWGARKLSAIEVIDKTRIPLVKFTHKETNIQIDVSFNQPSGPQAAQLMKTFLNALPPLRPLIFVIKYFLAARELNVPYNGGVGSYMMQLLLVSYLQQRERDGVTYGRPTILNLGGMLLEFFELFGLGFNYVTTGISVRHDGFFFPKGASSKREIFFPAGDEKNNSSQPPPFRCALENPLDTTMDVGKPSFRIQIVQRAFSAAYRVLLANVAEPLPQSSMARSSSVLATILPVSQEMTSRRVYKQFRLPLSAKRKRKGP